MSIEYSSNIQSSLDIKGIESIVEGILLKGKYEKLSVDESKVSLRIATLPKRDSWPEDIDIYFNEANIFVVFHVGSKTERDSFLNLLSKQLHLLGFESDFEEE